jgi:hypothetical protein
MRDTAPPPSRYPTMRDGQLADASKKALNFPTIPGLRPTAPEPGFINPLLDYDWGPGFNAVDGSGVPANAPPRIRQVIRTLVPKVNAVTGDDVTRVAAAYLDPSRLTTLVVGDHPAVIDSLRRLFGDPVLMSPEV